MLFNLISTLIIDTQIKIIYNELTVLLFGNVIFF